MLILAFLLALSVWLMQATCVLNLQILAFIPFLAVLILKASLKKTLWLAALVGILVDLLSDDPMGVHALNYVITCALFFRIKRLFHFEQLSLLAGMLSSLSTLLQWILLFLFDRRVPFNGKWIFADVVAMPVLDALYAFVWFHAPLALAVFLYKTWILYWLKKKSLSPTSR